MGRLLFVLLLFLPIAFCLDPVDFVFTPERDCKKSPSLQDNTWMAAVSDSKTIRFHQAAFISPRHVLTTKEAVIHNVSGTDEMKNVSNLRVVHFSDTSHYYFVESVIIPADYDEDTKEVRFRDLAIVQLNVSIGKDLLSPICPPEPSDILTTSVKAYYADEGRIKKEPISYDYSGDTEFLKTSSGMGREETILKDKFDRIVGIGLNETTAINIRYWEEFICEHTGICMKGHRMQNWQRISTYHYVENGKLGISQCTRDFYLNLIKTSTPFTRLNPQEAKELKETCGVAPSSSIDDSGSFFVTISAETESCVNRKCTFEATNCTGTLISQRHVITSADCIKSLDKPAQTTLTYVHYADSDAISKFSQDSSSSGYSDEIRLIWMSPKIRVGEIVAPPVDNSNRSIPRHERTILDNIAILELTEPIPQDSYTKPICLHRKSQPHPDDLILRNLVDPAAPTKSRKKYSVRYRQMHQDTPSMETSSDFILEETSLKVKDPCYDCPFLDFSYEETDLGSPIVHSIDDRWSLHGVVVGMGGGLNLYAMRPAYYSTFICIHTGICEDGETFTDRRLLPFDVLDPDVPPQLVLNLTRWSFMQNKMPKNWESVLSYHDEIAFYFSQLPLLHRLSAEEYARTREECGNTTEIFLDFAVKIGIVVPGHFFKREKKEMYCTGSLISRRHVITTRRCALMLLEEEKKQYNYVYYGAHKDDDLDNYKQAQIRLILIPDNNKSTIRDGFGMAILELAIEVLPGPYHQIVCLRDYNEIERNIASDQMNRNGVTNGDESNTSSDGNGQLNATVATGGFNKRADQLLWVCSAGLHESTVIYHYIGDEMTLRKNEESGLFVYESTGEVKGTHPHLGDNGTMYIRKSFDDNRYYLEGILTDKTSNSFSLLPAHLLYRDICRMSGVCPEVEDRRVVNDEHGIYVNNERLCLRHN